MSNNRLSVLPEELRTTAGALNQFSTDTDTTQQNLSRAWMRLDAGWDTYAEANLNGYYKEALNEIGRMAAMLSQMSAALHVTADLIADADRTAVASFHDLIVTSNNAQASSRRPPGLARMIPTAMVTSPGFATWTGQTFQQSDPPPWEPIVEWLRETGRAVGQFFGNLWQGLFGPAPIVTPSPTPDPTPTPSPTPTPTPTPSPTPVTPPQQNGFTQGATVYLNADGVNVRPNPTTANDPSSTTDDPLGQLSTGAAVTLVSGELVSDDNPADHHDWYEVDTPLGRGWIAAEFLAVSLLSSEMVIPDWLNAGQKPPWMPQSTWDTMGQKEQQYYIHHLREHPMPEEPSQDAFEFIAGHEGTVRDENDTIILYDDPAGNCTIGFGHLVHTGSCDGENEAELPYLDGITDEAAYDLLAADVTDAEQTVSSLVKVPLTQNQYDALVSFAFNVGPGNFESSDLLTKLNEGDYLAVPGELDRWIYGSDGNQHPGLVTRRTHEGDLFMARGEHYEARP